MDKPSQVRPLLGPEYSAREHRHRFATWAAARAAGLRLERGTTAALASALEGCGVVALVRDDIGERPSTAAGYDAAHGVWCQGVLDALQERGVTGATYGRGAKLLAIYLKTMVVVAGCEDMPFARVMHPPIDEILLKSLARDERFSAPARKLWTATAWTKLARESYAKLIESLRAEGLDQPTFWSIERYWRPTRDVMSRAAGGEPR